jgi:NAD(P)-dependent dehydrogenase (short-subunit alcohol dehydrogenase family)
MRLKDKVALITGGGRGIGKACALAFAGEGAIVVVTARTANEIHEVRDMIEKDGDRALAIQADLGREEDIIAMVSRTIDEFGKIDILVNNGGIIGPAMTVTDMKVDEWNETININLTGTMICSREVAKQMIAQKSGAIIMISSEGGRGGDGRGGRPLRAAYGCSKAAMIALAEAMAIELGPYGIRVNTISPGGVYGERLQKLNEVHKKAFGESPDEALKAVYKKISLGRFAEESEVAATAVFLASSESSAITGQVIPLNCGQHV